MHQQAWICCQIGGREHYAIPRSILRSGGAAHLVTDVWAAKKTGWLPSRWRQRHHPEIDDKTVAAWNWSALCLQTRLKLQQRTLWQRNVAVNDWFQRKACGVLPALVQSSPSPVTVFAYSYAARKIFQLAKQLGCHTVLGQIDPGPMEMQIVQDIERQRGDLLSEWPSPLYWDNWHSECNLADAIIVNSEWTREALLEEGIAVDRLHVIPLAYDQAAAPIPPSPTIPEHFGAERPLRVLFLGQVIPRKGSFELAEAIQLLVGRPVEWLIVGGGPAELLDRFRRLPQTTVTGAVSRHEVASYYRTADVFILPTHSDGFALTQLEALSYGLPVIASVCCGDVAVHNYNGLHLPDVTSAAIVNAVEQLIQSPQLLRRFAANSRVETAFSLAAVGKQLMALGASLSGGEL